MKASSLPAFASAKPGTASSVDPDITPDNAFGAVWLHADKARADDMAIAQMAMEKYPRLVRGYAGCWGRRLGTVGDVFEYQYRRANRAPAIEVDGVLVEHADAAG